MALYIIDTETTGTEDPKLVEVAWLGGNRNENHFCARYNPGKPISLGAMAVHHITDADVAHCPAAESFKLPADCLYIVGHNIDFDWRVIGQPDVKRICTLALSRYLFPGLDSYSLGAVLYAKLPNLAPVLTRNAHGAMADVLATQTLMEILWDHLIDNDIDGFDQRTLKKGNWEVLWEASEKARIPTVMPFGKHRGQPISTLPLDYMGWLLLQENIDPYLIDAISAEAARR